MASVVLYFHVHQPYRIGSRDVFSIGTGGNYFDSKEARLNNAKILQKVADKCYRPATAGLARLIDEVPGFRVSLSFSGLVLEQLEEFAPDVLKAFVRLVETGQVEVVGDTYYHSLAFVYSRDEFVRQVELHREKIKKVFGVAPVSFRNTELIYNNEVAKVAEELGFESILAEGVERYLDWRSPNFVYQPKGTEKIRLLLKNYQLSDDVAFRFSNREWSEWPLTAEKYAGWIDQINGNGVVVNLFMDYETLGEHQWKETGIFEFLDEFPRLVLRNPDNEFLTVSEAAWKYPVSDTVDMPELTSWADLDRDLSAWLSNPLQVSASKALYELEEKVMESRNRKLIEDWRRLTTSDHVYYMCTKWFSDGDVHKYFSPNESPFEAYNNFMNTLHDLRQRVWDTADDDSAKA